MNPVAKRYHPITSFQGRYEFLSNFHPCLVNYDGQHFPSAEHAFQAAKTTDKDLRMEIAYTKTPGRAKRMGRQLELRPEWDQIKVAVMETILRDKFSDPDLEEGLIDTHPRLLIEGNTWHDRFWGAEWDNGVWRGKNTLGKLLVKVRTDLVNQRRGG